MTTPGYSIKHWWRWNRLEGESLKAFARKMSRSGLVVQGTATRQITRGELVRASDLTGVKPDSTAGGWLLRKRAQKRREPTGSWA